MRTNNRNIFMYSFAGIWVFIWAFFLIITFLSKDGEEWLGFALWMHVLSMPIGLTMDLFGEGSRLGKVDPLSLFLLVIFYLIVGIIQYGLLGWLFGKVFMRPEKDDGLDELLSDIRK